MDTGTKKKLVWSGLIICIGRPLLCFAIGLALDFIYNTWGIIVGGSINT